MNAYRTPHMRSAPQIQQRRFDITIDGKPRTAHGIKGANGEWMLEIYDNGWQRLGNAYKEAKGWTLYTVEGSTFTGTTLKATIAAVFQPRKETP